MIGRVSTSVVPVLPKHVRRVRLPYPAPAQKFPPLFRFRLGAKTALWWEFFVFRHDPPDSQRSGDTGCRLRPAFLPTQSSPKFPIPQFFPPVGRELRHAGNFFAFRRNSLCRTSGEGKSGNMGERLHPVSNNRVRSFCRSASNRSHLRRARYDSRCKPTKKPVLLTYEQKERRRFAASFFLDLA